MGAIDPRFTAQMGRLRGLKFAPTDITTHWEGLHDLEPELLAAAVDHAQKTCDEFPSPSQLRQLGERLRSRVLPAPQPVDRRGARRVAEFQTPFGTIVVKREWNYYCQDCSDSGWVTVWCAGRLDEDGDVQASGRRTLACEYTRDCERRGPHGAHEWSTPCPCAATNPDVIRRRERERVVKRGGEE
jgi:hypothetical protein